MDAATDTDDLAGGGDCCPICLDPAAVHGGKPLFAPGCCGAWMHLECAYALAADRCGDGQCPLCRAAVALPAKRAAAPTTDERPWWTFPRNLEPIVENRSGRWDARINLPMSPQEECDISFVIEQSQCTRDEAIRALRNNYGNLVHAVMELSI